MLPDLDQQSSLKLRRQVMWLARRIRHNTLPENLDFNRPQEVSQDVIFFEGKNQQRKRLLLLTKGCSIASCTMCPLPNEALSHDSGITSSHIIHQFDQGFTESEAQSFDVLTIYNNGNFFADAEIEPEVRQHIYRRVAASTVKTVIVESLPQFITRQALQEAQAILKDKRLAIAIGLQSADDEIRELAVNTICTKTDFERAVKLMSEFDYKPLVFLMIKPPFVTEEEGIIEAVSSVKYLQSLGIDEAILCPTKIDEATIANELFKRGQFSPPWLWSVVEILKQIYRNESKHPARIATSLIRPTKQEKSRVAANCSVCTSRVIDMIERFNNSKDLSILDEVMCECFDRYKEDKKKEQLSLKEKTIQQRVQEFISDYMHHENL